MPHRAARLISVAVATILPLAACSADQDDPDEETTSDPKVITLAHPFPAESLSGRAAESYAGRVEEASGGKLEVEVTAEAEIGVGEELTSQLEDGDDDAVLVGTSTTGLDPRLKLQSLPFLATSPDEADELFYGEGLVADYEAAVFEEHGVHAVYQFEMGFRGLSTSGPAVRLPKDLAGLSIRVFRTPWMLEALKSWGATPADVPADKLKGALEKREIDGQESSVRFFVGSELTDVQDTFTDLRHTYATFTLLMGDAAWTELSGEEQEILTQAAREASESNREDVRAADDRDYESLRDKVELVEPTAEEYTAWRASLGDLYAEYRQAFGKKIIKKLSQRASS